MATIQTRLTSDNKQHDEAFKRSKQQVYNYNKQVDKSKASVLKFAKGGLGALSTALGVAGGAMAVFDKTMRATQKTSDKFDSVMSQAKASVDYFFTSLSRGDFSGFLSGLKDIVSQAKEAQKAIDDLGTTTLLASNAGAKYEADRAKLERIIKDPKSGDAERKAAQSQLDNLRNEYIPELEKESKAAWKAFYEKGRQAFKNVGFMTPSDQMLLEFFSGNERYEFWGTVYSQLKEITDEELKTVSDLLKQAYASERAVNQLYISDSRLEKYGNTNTSTSTKTTKIDENNKWDEKEYLKNIEWNVNHYYTKLREKLNEKKITFTPILDPVIEERSDSSLENILNTATEMEYWSAKKFEDAERRKQEAAEKTAEIVNLQLDIISSLSSAFSTLGNAFDSKELNIAGIIAEAIANIAKAYSVASAKQAEGSITGWDWLAFSVGGLAQVASVISQIHSLSGYAEGGIIGGNSYTGDKVLARVNSGEMILNPSQQANLFNMINGGVSTGGEVKFRIEGSTLVGVLNNYNKKFRRVM